MHYPILRSFCGCNLGSICLALSLLMHEESSVKPATTPLSSAIPPISSPSRVFSPIPLHSEQTKDFDFCLHEVIMAFSNMSQFSPSFPVLFLMCATETCFGSSSTLRTIALPAQPETRVKGQNSKQILMGPPPSSQTFPPFPCVLLQPVLPFLQLS